MFIPKSFKAKISRNPFTRDYFRLMLRLRRRRRAVLSVRRLAVAGNLTAANCLPFNSTIRATGERFVPTFRAWVAMCIGLLLTSMLIGLIGLARPAIANAATANTINFQARLMGSSGSIVQDGSYNIEFKLYDAASSSGSGQGSCTGDSACLWTETRTGANKVTVANGYLTVNLGSVAALPANIWNQQLWLSMRIGGTGTPGWDTEMSPRLSLTAVPAAYALTNSSGSVTSSLTLQAGTGVAGQQDFVIQDQGAPGTYNLCIQNSTACGFALATGGTGYIQNGTTVQTNTSFFIQPTSGNTGGVIKANGTGDLLVLQNTTGGVLTKFNSNGDLTIGGSSAAGSTTALLIQNASNGTVLSVDTNHDWVGINNASPGAALDVVAAGPVFFDGFENGVLAPLTSSAPAWTASNAEAHTGSNSAYTILNTGQGNSTASLTETLSAPGNISFYYTCSLAFSYDSFAFSLDGVSTTLCNGASAGWTNYSASLGSGSHTFAWTLNHTSGLSPSESAAIDDLNITNVGTGYAALFNGGNVGIGTTTPTAATEINNYAGSQVGLVVRGSVGQTANIFEVRTNPTSNTLLFGIGSDGSINTSSGITSQDAGGGNITPLTLISSLSQSANILTVKRSDNTSYLTVDSSGNVGIGASSPAALLSVGSSGQFQVDGSGNVLSTSVKAGAIIGYSSGAGAPLRIDASGSLGVLRITNVGVHVLGNTNPSYPLDVQGDINTSAAYRFTNSTYNLSLNTATLSANRAYTFPYSTAATDTICLQTLANCSGGGVTTIGTFADTNVYANAASISGSTITIGAADSLNPGVVTTGNQTFSGDKMVMGNLSSTGELDATDLWINTGLFSADSTLNNVVAGGAFIALTGAQVQGSIDSYGGSTLDIGATSGGTATAINLNQDVTVASGKNLTVSSGAFNVQGTPPVSATASLIRIGNAISGGNASGTYIGISSPASGAGSVADFLNFQSGWYGGSVFQVADDGSTTISGNLLVSSAYADTVTLNEPTTVYAGGTSPALLVGSSIGPSLKVQGGSGSSYATATFKESDNTQTGDLLQLQDYNGIVGSKFNVTGNQLTLGTLAASGTVYKGKLVVSDGTTDNFGLTLQSSTLTASRTYNFPNSSAATDTICLQTLANCSGGGGVATIGGLDGGTANANGATISGTTLYLQSASNTSPGLVNTTSQSFWGNKTFVNDTTFGSGSGTVSVQGYLDISGSSASPSLSITTTPAASATKSLVQLGGAIAGGNAVTNGGTYIGLNAPSTGAGSAADFLNFQKAGSIKFKVDNTGAITAGSLNVSGIIQGSNDLDVNGEISSFSLQTNGGIVNAVSNFAVGGVNGVSATCAGGQVLQNQVVTGGIVTGGTCASAGGGVTTIGALDGGTYSANGASISGSTIYLQAATGTHVGLVTTGSQTFAGDKTFSGSTHFGGTTVASDGTITTNTSANLYGIYNGGAGISGVSSLSIQANSGQSFDVLDALSVNGNGLSLAKDGTATFYDDVSTNVGLTVGKGLGSNAGALYAYTNGLGNAVFGSVNGSGIGGKFSSNGGSSGLFQTANTSGTDSAATLVAELNTSQTADLFQLQNTSGVALSGFNSSGSLFFKGGTNTVSINTAAQANSVALTIPADTNTTDTICLQTLANCSGGGGVAAIGALDGGTANASGATISGTTLYLQSASASFPGLITTGTQTIVGAKTFNTGVTLNGGPVVNGGLTISGNSSTSGSFTFSSTITVSGTASLNGAATLNGLTTLNNVGGKTLVVQTAPTATATQSVIQIGSAIAGGNATTNGGTYLGLNAPSSGAGSAADFLNFQKAGSSKFKVDNAGDLTVGGALSVGDTIMASSTIVGSGFYAGLTNPGVTSTCSGGQVLQNQVVIGGIVTGGTCASAGGGVTTIGALDGGTANSNGATISSTTLYLQSASSSFAGLVNTGTQTFAGDKTFSGTVYVNNGLAVQAGANLSGGTTIQAFAGNALYLTGTPNTSATSSMIQIGNAIVGGNTATNGGTYLGLNAPSTGAGSAADFLNFQHNGTSVWKLGGDGTFTLQSSGGSQALSFDSTANLRLGNTGGDVYAFGYNTRIVPTNNLYVTAYSTQIKSNGTNNATAFQIQDSSGATALSVSTNNIATGANAANAMLVVNKDSGTGRSINAAGTINASGADFAEYYYQQHPGSLNAGQLVCLTDSQTVDSCTDGSVITGVVSANAGYVGNDIFDAAHPEKTAIVGMLGQLPVKVNMEGGAVKPGDPIGISSVPGVGMKVTDPGTPIVGYAMAAATQDSTVKVLVRPGYYTPSGKRLVQGGQKYVNPLTVNGALVADSINIGGLADMNELRVTGTATIGGNLSVDGDLTVHGVTRLAELLVSGHILSQAGTPQVVAGTAAGQDGEVTIDGTDTAGTITVTVGANKPSAQEAKDGQVAETLTAGALAEVSFAKNYELTPRVVISPDNADSTDLPVYVLKTDTGFQLVARDPAANGKTYQFDYVILGSQDSSQVAR